jgi:hypothetical protein
VKVRREHMESMAKRRSAAFVCVLIVAVGSVGGCGNATNNGIKRNADIGPASGITEVGSLSVSDTTVTFYSETRDGAATIGMSESGSAFAKSTLVAPLLAKRLTTQEIYLALAPTGAVVPPALVLAQESEATMMGRSVDVQHVAVNAAALVEKDLVSCQTAILGGTTPDGGDTVWTSYGGSAYTNQCGNLYGTCSTDWWILGGCNTGKTTILLAAEENGSGCEINEPIGSANNLPGHYHYWYWHNSSSANYEIIAYPNPNCSPNAYDLVIGYETSTSRPPP